MAEFEEPRADEARGDEGQEAAYEPTSLQAQLDEARSSADEQRRKAEAYLDLAQRAQADFQNYKRRQEQEREQLVKQANADLLRQILPVLDDLERALTQVPGDMAEHTWTQGVTLIGQKLQHVLEQQGLSRVGAEGEEFDPHVHEAVGYEEHPQYGEGQIARVYRPGYRLQERVLRPAQVVVARGSSASPVSSSVTMEARAEQSPPSGRRRTAERQGGAPEDGRAI